MIKCSVIRLAVITDLVYPYSSVLCWLLWSSFPEKGTSMFLFHILLLFSSSLLRLICKLDIFHQIVFHYVYADHIFYCFNFKTAA